MRILSVVGNRPQFIKSAPLSLALREPGIDEVVLHTGQHWDAALSEVFFDELGLAEPRYRLDLQTADAAAMEPGDPRGRRAERPDWVLVYGDTNSTLRRRRTPPGTSRSPTSRRACAASTSRCPRSETGSPSTGSRRCCSARTSARPRNSRSRASAGRRVVVGDVMADATRLFGPLARERSRVLARSALEPRRYAVAPSTARPT